MNASEREIRAKRKQTVGYIKAAPVVLQLIPTEQQITPAGGKARNDALPREAQTFRLIPMTFDERVTITAGGVERIISHTLLGTHDCIMQLWDRWDGDDGSWFQIVGFAPGHEYETKGLVEQHLPGV